MSSYERNLAVAYVSALNHFLAISNDLFATVAAAIHFPAVRPNPFVFRRMDQSPIRRPQKSGSAAAAEAAAEAVAAAVVAAVDAERNSVVDCSVCCFRYAIGSD